MSDLASRSTLLPVINLSFEWCVTLQKVAKLFKRGLCVASVVVVMDEAVIVEVDVVCAVKFEPNFREASSSKI